MSHADTILDTLVEVTGGPLPTVLPLEGVYERPTAKRVEPPKPAPYVVWATLRDGTVRRFPALLQPATAVIEGGIEARGKFPGQVVNHSVRLA